MSESKAFATIYRLPISEVVYNNIAIEINNFMKDSVIDSLSEVLEGKVHSIWLAYDHDLVKSYLQYTVNAAYDTKGIHLVVEGTLKSFMHYRYGVE